VRKIWAGIQAEKFSGEKSESGVSDACAGLYSVLATEACACAVRIFCVILQQALRRDGWPPLSANRIRPSLHASARGSGRCASEVRWSLGGGLTRACAVKSKFGI
jgi:hypothetical protein